MLPGEEFAFLKRRHEAEKAAKKAAAAPVVRESYGYDNIDFALAMNSMSQTPQQKMEFFRLQNEHDAERAKYAEKRRCQSIATAKRQKSKPQPQPKPVLMPMTKPEYSHPQVRDDFTYRPNGLQGKAGEVLGTTNRYVPKKKVEKPLSKCCVVM